MKAIVFHTTTFTEEELEITDRHGNVVDYGDIPYNADNTVTEKVVVNASWDDLLEGQSSCFLAADAIKERGLSFDATGNDWCADPDGSQVIDYVKGERAEVTGHLNGFTDEEIGAIMWLVGS